MEVIRKIVKNSLPALKKYKPRGISAEGKKGRPTLPRLLKKQPGAF